MKFSLSWLKAHLDTDADINAVANCLNRIGLEVEGIENPAEALRAFRIAHVLSAAPHPQADKLQVLTIDQGDGQPLQVVCGAPNARAGMKGIFGPAGATVPGNGMQLKVAAIRGVESNGMMCSLAELNLGDDHDGIAELSADAPVGRIYADWAGLDDPVIDVSITPNRQDCMGVRGIARDLAAAGLGKLKPLDIPTISAVGPCPIQIRTDDSEACPAFYGRVITGVNNGTSPDWMQARLKSAGQKLISALVDITNYVMLDHGRPSHAYDLAKLNGAVVARRANDGEQMVALNDKSYILTSDMTVIADDSGVHDIAGIMGGAHSGCSQETRDVLLEIAYFTPERIAKTGQALALTSDARSRFERGVDPGFLDNAMEMITALIIDICGGQASDIVRAGQPPLDARALAYDPAYCARLGGVDVATDQQKTILESLGFDVSADWMVTVPTWRRDIDGPADLVEEVVRIYGIDNIPSCALPRADGVARPTATPLQSLERKMRRAAAAQGLHEAINWSFISQKDAQAVRGSASTDATLVLANPISEDMKVMRPSLLPGLLSAVQRNMDRGASSLRLFEIGRRYLVDGEYPTLSFILAGDRQARHWQTGKAQSFDAYDAKAIVEALLMQVGVDVPKLMVMGFDDTVPGDVYHPGQSATLRLGPKKVLASFGMLHPSMAKSFDVGGAIAIATIHLDAIPIKKGDRGAGGFMRSGYTPPVLQAVTRDFAFLVPTDKAAGDLVASIRGSDKVNIVAARIFDRFAGAGVPQGQLSLAVEVTLQPQNKSYTDDELKAISDRIIAAAGKQGAELRG